MNCPQIPQIDFSSFSQDLSRHSVEKRIPISGSIDLTYKCNLDCVHCYRPKNNKEELSTDQWKNIIEQIVEAGCMFLTISGGEPLSRPDFFDIYTFAKNKGLLITLFSNGIAINVTVADKLKKDPPLFISMSMYGASNETYQAITGSAAFTKFTNALRLLRERKIEFRLKTMAMKGLLSDLGLMRKIAEDFQTYLKVDPEINPTLEGDQAPCSYRLEIEEIVEVEKDDERRLPEWVRLSKLNEIRDDSIFACMGGTNSFHVNAFGELQLCLLVKDPQHDLVNDNFQSGWAKFSKVREGKLPQDSPCIGCEDVMLCNQCPGWSLVVNNDLVTKVPFLCTIAKKRKLLVNDIKGGVR